MTFRELLPTDAPPPIDAPLPHDLRERGLAIIRRTGVVDVDVDGSWRAYVAWLVERAERDKDLLPEQCAVTEGRWSQWVEAACSTAARARLREHEREWSGPRARPPYHRRLAVPDVEPPSPPRRPLRGLPRMQHSPAALEAAKRLAKGDF